MGCPVDQGVTFRYHTGGSMLEERCQISSTETAKSPVLCSSLKKSVKKAENSPCSPHYVLGIMDVPKGKGGALDASGTEI